VPLFKPKIVLLKTKTFPFEIPESKSLKNAPLFKTESRPSVHFSKPKLALLKYEKAHRCTLFEPKIVLSKSESALLELKITLSKRDKGYLCIRTVTLLKPKIGLLKHAKPVFVRTVSHLRPKTILFKHDKGSLLKPTIAVLKQVKTVFVRTLSLLKPKSVFFTKVKPKIGPF
jgi:hypothetical protein